MIYAFCIGGVYCVFSPASVHVFLYPCLEPCHCGVRVTRTLLTQPEGTLHQTHNIVKIHFFDFVAHIYKDETFQLRVYV